MRPSSTLGREVCAQQVANDNISEVGETSLLRRSSAATRKPGPPRPRGPRRSDACLGGANGSLRPRNGTRSGYHLQMSDQGNADAYLHKANESLLGAESECANRRFSNCANRAYYAAFQAAISALIRAGIRSRSGGQWPHGYVQAEFVGKLINRNRRYPSSLRPILSSLLVLRSRADYETVSISELEAQRGLRRSREFVEQIKAGGGNPQ